MFRRGKTHCHLWYSVLLTSVQKDTKRPGKTVREKRYGSDSQNTPQWSPLNRETTAVGWGAAQRKGTKCHTEIAVQACLYFLQNTSMYSKVSIWQSSEMDGAYSTDMNGAYSRQLCRAVCLEHPASRGQGKVRLIWTRAMPATKMQDWNLPVASGDDLRQETPWPVAAVGCRYWAILHIHRSREGSSTCFLPEYRMDRLIPFLIQKFLF